MYRIALGFLLIILAFMVVGIVGCESQEEAEKQVSSQPVYTFVLAEKLFEDYEANEVAADEKYKGKILKIYGTIEDIGKDIAGQIYVTLKVKEYSISSVQCFFSTLHKNEVAQLVKGQTIMIKGRCGGKGISNVVLEGCVFAYE